MEDLRVFEVVANWKIFRMPISSNEIDSTYLDMERWLNDNCKGTWKLFEISHGNRGNSVFGTGIYGRLLEVDLIAEEDIVAFKLRWL